MTDYVLATASSLSSVIGPTPGLAVSLAAGWIGAALGGLPHELAHAAIARGRGATHVRVVIGLGPGLRLRLPWPPLHWLSLHLRVCPTAGHARAHGPGLDGDAEAQAAIALAGPLASLGFAAALVLVLTWLPAATPSPSPLAGLARWSVLDGVIFSACGALQLVPGVGTDGSRALHAVRALRRPTGASRAA